MSERTQQIAEKVLENTPIVSGATTATGSFLGFLDTHAGAMGVIFTAAAFFVNLGYKEYYRRKSLHNKDK